MEIAFEPRKRSTHREHFSPWWGCLADTKSEKPGWPGFLKNSFGAGTR